MNELEMHLLRAKLDELEKRVAVLETEVLPTKPAAKPDTNKGKGTDNTAGR